MMRNYDFSIVESHEVRSFWLGKSTRAFAFRKRLGLKRQARAGMLAWELCP